MEWHFTTSDLKNLIFTSSETTPTPNVHKEVLPEPYDAFFQTYLRFHWPVKCCSAFPGLKRWNKARVLAYFFRTLPLMLHHHWSVMTLARLSPPAPVSKSSSCLTPTQQFYKVLLVKLLVLIVFLVCMAKEKQWAFYYAFVFAFPTHTKREWSNTYLYYLKE